VFGLKSENAIGSCRYVSRNITLWTINCRIVNSTCAIPWASDIYQFCPVRIGVHKNGTPSTGNIARNNIATGIGVDAGSTVAGHNTFITRSVYPDYFIDPAHFSFRLKAAAAAVNTGSTLMAPTIDLAQTIRDATPDIGAYEYKESSSVAAPKNLKFAN
jgi:hypothetical protein